MLIKIKQPKEDRKYLVFLKNSFSISIDNYYIILYSKSQ